MSRLNPSTAKTPRAPTPTPPSAAYIASTVNTYMASIETAATQSSPSTRSKQKLRLKKSSSASAAAAAGGTASPRRGNFCRNPFCGEKLTNTFAKFCDQKVHCQLYRGLLLHCGSFASERGQAVDNALDKLRETKRRRLRRATSESDSPTGAAATATTAEFSIPKRKVPISSSTSAPSSMSSEATTEGDRLRRRYERTQQAATSGASGEKARSTIPTTPAAAAAPLSSAQESSNGKKRRLNVADRGSENSAAGALVGTSSQIKPPQPAPAAPSRPPAPVNKVGGIEVIPLGAGRHSTSFGGGSRYVQSGNRSAMSEDLRANNPLARPPSTPKPPTPAEAVAPALPPRTGSVDPRLQQRAPAWVDSGRNQPTGRNEVTPSSSPVQDAQATTGPSTRGAMPQSAKRTISASEYLNSRKPQDPRLRSSLQSNGELHGSTQPSASSALRRSSSDLSSVPASAFQNGVPRERTLSRSLSEMSAQRYRGEVSYRDPEPGYSRSAGDLSSSSGSRPPPYKDSSYARSSSYETPPSYSRQEYDSRGDSFQSDRQPPPRPYSPERHHHEYSYEPDYHRPSSSYSQDRSEWERRNEEPPRPQYRDQAPFATAPPRPNNDRPTSQQQHQNQQQQQQHPQVQAAQSSQQRDASMLPEVPMAMFSSHDRFIVNLLSRFASFYPKALAPVLNKTKKPRKMRFYLDYVERVKVLSGSRFDILETLLDQSTAWRKLVEDSHRVYGNSVKRLGDRADRSTAFIRMWHGMKYNVWDKFPTERVVTYFRGDTRHHWTFCVGTVELGSGSHEEKREAFRLATENSMRFLLSLEILSDSQKYVDERERDREQTDRRGPQESDQHRAAGNSDRASRDSNRPRTSSGMQASRQPVSAASGAVVEIVDAPETTLSRARDGSFGSDADGAFSPGGRSVSDEDMDISEGDDGA